jgi:hypothetical protein
MSCWSQLHLSWPRARHWQSLVASLPSDYPLDEVAHRGGADETRVAHQSDNDRAREWSATLGSGLPTPAAMGPNTSAGSGDTATGPTFAGGVPGE